MGGGKQSWGIDISFAILSWENKSLLVADGFYIKRNSSVRVLC